jgi:para-aminobenzoate synthetase
MKTLLIDNYDSFTYNLFQLLAEANGEEPFVVRNDEASWAELVGFGFDNVVISPGPGRPDREGDFGVCAEAIRRSAAPLLGVCLGHQGLGSAFGARVVPAPEPVHGRLSTVIHDGSPLFAGTPHEFQAVRYHSLCVKLPLPAELQALAWTTEGLLMAVAHRDRPLWGVQFHPESICTEHGRQLLANFRDLTRASLQGTSHSWRRDEFARRRGGGDTPERADTQSAALISAALVRAGMSPPPLPQEGSTRPSLKVRRLEEFADPEQVFAALYGESENAFWLDSSRIDESARFSFMGDDSGPLGATVFFDLNAGEVRVEREGAVERRRESIFDYLGREMQRPCVAAEELPFEFECGFAGYLGYELKAECGGEAAHESPLPDAAFVFAARMLAFDHREQHTYLLCLVEPGGEAEAERWLEATVDQLASLSEPPRAGALFSGYPRERRPAGSGIEFRLARSHERYLEEIAECKRLLAEGETYEVCLTNKVRTEIDPDPMALYRALRRINPAPFAAYLRFGEIAVLSSSPERFLRIGPDRWVEAKPIKGTCRRGVTAAEDVRLAERLRSDEKNRAENLMIADLLRNDLGAVCEVGTVHVPDLMQVESYETVHQLVSTVRGLLREELSPPDCIRACFPPGSMTGAPKRRTMRILDQLEGEARGVYSGAIGYLGLSGGCDLSVAIRTIVVDGESTTIGAGGAIVAQSDPEDEYGEMLLKASAPMRALDPGVDLARALRPTAGSGSAHRSAA